MPRNAQVWAQQILAGTMAWLKQQTNPPNMPTALPGELAGQTTTTLQLPKGQAIRLCQETNLAIKQYNRNEERARRERQAMQENAARTDPTIQIPDYEPEKIYWNFKYTEVAEGIYEIIIDYPTRKAPRTRSMLAQLGDLFARVSAPANISDQDPLEKWLEGNGGNGEK